MSTVTITATTTATATSSATSSSTPKPTGPSWNAAEISVTAVLLTFVVLGAIFIAYGKLRDHSAIKKIVKAKDIEKAAAEKAEKEEQASAAAKVAAIVRSMSRRVIGSRQTRQEHSGTSRTSRGAIVDEQGYSHVPLTPIDGQQQSRRADAYVRDHEEDIAVHRDDTMTHFLENNHPIYMPTTNALTHADNEADRLIHSRTPSQSSSQGQYTPFSHSRATSTDQRILSPPPAIPELSPLSPTGYEFEEVQTTSRTGHASPCTHPQAMRSGKYAKGDHCGMTVPGPGTGHAAVHEGPARKPLVHRNSLDEALAREARWD